MGNINKELFGKKIPRIINEELINKKLSNFKSGYLKIEDEKDYRAIVLKQDI